MVVNITFSNFNIIYVIRVGFGQSFGLGREISILTKLDLLT